MVKYACQATSAIFGSCKENLNFKICKRIDQHLTCESFAMDQHTYAKSVDQQPLELAYSGYLGK